MYYLFSSSAMKKLNNIQSAVGMNGGHSRLSLDQPMITSAKIGQIIPIYHEALVPGDHVKVNTSVFSRFAPLAVPSYVHLNLRTMTVFVPYHQLADGCESFFQNQDKFHGKYNHIPVIKFSTLSGFLGSNGISLPGGSATSYDLALLSASGTPVFRNLTPKGNYIVKVLRSLGYNVGKQIFANQLGDMAQYDFDMSALPLLAFCHAYNSYMSYSPATNTSALSQCLEDIKRQSSSAGYSLTGSDLNILLSDILLTYDDNLFTMAWSQPYGNQQYSSDQGFSNVSMSLPLGNGSTVSSDWDGSTGATTAVQPGSPSTLTSSQIRLVMKFDDFFRRSQYAGSKDIEQIYSRLGVKVDDFRCRYPYFLRESTQPVSIGDVTSTSDTSVDTQGAVTGGALGSYAGKAISDGGTSFDFDCHDYGMLITLAWYAPVVQYYNGYDKEVLRVNPLDYYQPEFDQGFADALNVREFRGSDLWVNNQGSQFVTNNPGFVPLYSQYLFGRQYIVGDFRRFAEFNSWHFGRDVLSTQMSAQSSSLVYMPNIGTEYERIFNIVDPSLADADTIYIDVFNNVKASRPMKDYTGKVGLGDGDIDVGLNGSQLN